MRKIVLAALFAATAATPALAQEKAPFTGLRAEGIIGYDRISDGTDGDAGSSDGLLYGGQLGYDFQAGGLVLGIEGEVTGATTDTRADSLLVAGDRLVLDAGRDYYVGGRIGGAISPQALVYAKAGYTNAKLNSEYRTGTTVVRDSAELDGWRIGAGVEYKLTPQFHLKGEYRYSNYGEIDGFDTDVDRHQVLAGIGVRF